jgi:hypothetical protein
LDLAVWPGLGTRARRQFRQQYSIRQFANTGPGFFIGEKTLFFLQRQFALRLRCLHRDPGFVLVEDLFDLLVFQRQWLALIGLLQAVDERLKLKIGNLLAQAFTEARTQAVSEVVSVIFGVFSAAWAAEKSRTTIKK